MKRFTDVNDPEIAKLLLAPGGVGVLRTDTLYGIVARADDEVAVQRVYHLKDRDETKSPIVLVASIDQLYDGVPEAALRILRETWPGPVSIILPSQRAPIWLRRENDSIAYRLPNSVALQKLITLTGPLIAPSANPQDHVPAMSYEEAYDYFGDRVDFYVDNGIVADDRPSKLLKIDTDGELERLR